MPSPSLRAALGWALSALWLVVVGWGFWQTEVQPQQQRFVVSAATRQQVDRLEHWYRVNEAHWSSASPTLIVDLSVTCPCTGEGDAAAEDWTDLEAQGLQVVQRAALQGNPLPAWPQAALTLFSAEGKLLYAGPANLGPSCGHLSLAAVFAQGLQINQAPFGTPIVADRCDCDPQGT